ncbi:unnamed protein product [Trifolium pratense]|uniref:Uncharacterized protein n=1 Tax=Trifolium pratense TaxID=57577 RepID=A0ACB0J5F0_TRIPR|nr:unnamed protein product [Trifolium pratense]
MTRASSSSAKNTQKSREMKKKRLQRKTGGSTSKKNGADIWALNFFKRTKIRRNGRKDYYYIHKYEEIICRSLKEVERFENDGILPNRKAK